MKQSKANLEADVDALFRLPLTEFISARKTLAARLKQEGHGDQADRVKTLVKPPLSAWAVNQLYWMHRAAFDRLIATGQNFRRAQGSRLAGKAADLRGLFEARREALSELTTLATALLDDAGHHPTLDMIRRITTTLEGVSAYASLPDELVHGRLTHDVDPPGFDTLGPFAAGAMPKRTKEPAPVTPSRKAPAATKAPQKAEPSSDARQIEKIRQAKIATARASVQEAKRDLSKARTRAENAEAAQKKAIAEAKQKENQSREAEKLLAMARASSEAAARRAQGIAAAVKEAAQAVKRAEHTLEAASKEVESLFGELSD